MADKPASLRLRQGLILLAGALVFELLVGNGGGRDFYWTPLALGLAYLAAALLGGRRGGYWPTALVLVSWGAAVIWVARTRPDLDTSGVYLAAVGIGAVVAVVLARRGVRVDPLGVAGTIAAAGLVLAVSSRWDRLTDQRTYAVALGAVGLFNVVAGVARR